MCTTSGRKKSWVILTIGSSRFITVSVLAGESAVKARLQTSFHTRTTASFTTWSSTNNAHFSILEDVMLLLPCAAVYFLRRNSKTRCTFDGEMKVYLFPNEVLIWPPIRPQIHDFELNRLEGPIWGESNIWLTIALGYRHISQVSWKREGL